VLVPGQGQPVNVSPAPGNLVTITLSGVESNCKNITIPVLPPTATFTLSCETAKFNGAYVKGKQLTSANTVNFNVNVSDISTGGSWAVTSDNVNGISFSGSGMFATVGPQMITLQGVGTPTGTDPITLKFTTNSGDGPATCNATVQIAIPPMTILGLGGNGALYDYTMVTSGGNGLKMLMDTKNFGTLDNSTVKFGDGNKTWTIDARSGNISDAATVAALTTNPPDIVVIAYPYTTASNSTAVQAIVNYIKKGGVVLMYSEYNPASTGVINGLFGSNISVVNTGGTAGARYQFPTFTDPVLNGPFGSLNGLFWGEDASVTTGFNLVDPKLASQITVYTTYASGSGAASTDGFVMLFRANKYNFIFSGDGGFNSSGNATSPTICPFYISPTAPYIPLPKSVSYSGAGTMYGAGPVYNAVFSANALAWALNQALTNGINPH